MDDLENAYRTFGPQAPEIADAFREVDAKIGTLARSEAAAATATVIVSDGAPFSCEGTLEVGAIEGEVFAEEQVCHIRTSDLASTIRSLPQGVGTLANPASKAVYRIGHPAAGDVILIAPPTRRFGASGEDPKSTRGHLPLAVEQYGIFVSTEPVPSIEEERFALAVDVLSAVKEIVAR
jgi:hypothetical protein